MNTLIVIIVVVAVLVLLMLVLAVRIVRQYERGVVFRLGRLSGARAPGLRLIIPFVDVMHVDVMHKVSLRIVTAPIQSQGIGVDKNTTVVFPAPLMSTIEELVTFLTRENNAANGGKPPAISYPNGTVAPTR